MWFLRKYGFLTTENDRLFVSFRVAKIGRNEKKQEKEQYFSTGNTES